jgi:hypothetical protein
MTAAEDYFLTHYQAGIPGYRTRKAGERDLLSMTKAALLEAIRIVIELPRSHYVWQPGYAEQTPNRYRMRDFCAFRLREDPGDELALWTRIGLSISATDLEFGRSYFRKLMEKDGFDVRWPVYAACYCQQAWTGSTPLPLGSFLRENGLLEGAMPTVNAIREQRDPYIDVFENEDFGRDFAAECIEIAMAT